MASPYSRLGVFLPANQSVTVVPMTRGVADAFRLAQAAGVDARWLSISFATATRAPRFSKFFVIVVNIENWRAEIRPV
jgi:hypothetical protein